MRNRTMRWIGMGSLVALGFLGCNQTQKDTSKVLVSTQDLKITETQFKEVVKILIGDDQKAGELLTNSAMQEQRNQFLESLALQKAMVLMARTEGLEKDQKAQVLLEQRTAQVYLQTLTERRLPKNEPSESELRTLYDGLVLERKAAGQDKGLPTFDEVKPQLPAIWKQKQEQTVTENLFKELRQKYPFTFAEGYKPTPQPGQP